jgi:hypothetical protein
MAPQTRSRRHSKGRITEGCVGSCESLIRMRLLFNRWMGTVAALKSSTAVGQSEDASRHGVAAGCRP